MDMFVKYCDLLIASSLRLVLYSELRSSALLQTRTRSSEEISTRSGFLSRRASGSSVYSTSSRSPRRKARAGAGGRGAAAVGSWNRSSLDPGIEEGNVKLTH